MDCLARILTERLLVYNLIKSDAKENYEYAIQIHLEQFIGFCILLIISILYDFFYETIIFLVFFTYIRRYSGGFHIRSFIGCIFYSITIYSVYVLLLYPFFLENMRMNMIFVVVSFLIVLFIGAVNHPGMHWSIKEYSISRNTARVVAAIEASCIMLLYILGVSYSYILFMSFGLTLSAIMLLFAKILRQEVSCYEERT